MRLWLYHATEGAQLFEGVTAEQVSELLKSGWLCHPDQAVPQEPAPAPEMTDPKHFETGGAENYGALLKRLIKANKK